MSIKVIVEGIIFAFQLLTTLPITKQVPYQRDQVRISVMSYPLVGAVLGAIIVGLLIVSTQLANVSQLVVSLIIVTLSIIYTGGLHLDGWMDCSDAFFSYKSQAEKLEIMKDSRIGAFAALSLFLLLAWKLVLIYEVIPFLSIKEYVLIALIPFFSRMNVGMKLYYGKLAREDGMAFAMRKYISKKDSISYLIMIILVLVLTFIFFPMLFLSIVILVLSNGCFYLLSTKIDHAIFGGITGDTLGASVEGGELWLWMTLYLLLFFGMV